MDEAAPVKNDIPIEFWDMFNENKFWRDARLELEKGDGFEHNARGNAAQAATAYKAAIAAGFTNEYLKNCIKNYLEPFALGIEDRNYIRRMCNFFKLEGDHYFFQGFEHEQDSVKKHKEGLAPKLSINSILGGETHDRPF